MSVIGTAGHVDHGKSTLVRALSGIDPDRLQEEKDRGMTIDLGFAWLTLPGGKEASIVDVPGHEGFIKNMLAGVGGIDLAMLIVAADDGVMPQTREHLAILDLLQVKQGLVVVTKKDIVDDEWLELVVSDIQELLQPTFLASAPIVAASSVTGEGIEEVLSTIDSLLDYSPPKRDIGRPRLPIDRAFSVSGFGTVVTGTLMDGQLSVGQEVAILPGSQKARIRGLQTHRQKVATALPGSRVAVNLTGVSAQDLERGKIVTVPGWLSPTLTIDAKLTMIPDAMSSLVHGAGVMVHLFAAQVPGRLRLLDTNVLEPGQTGYAQIRLADPFVTTLGDRFIIRNGAGTVAGGEVVDVRPRRHRRFHSPTIDSLTAVSGGIESMLLSLLGKYEPCEFKDIVTMATLPTVQVKEVINRQIETGMVVCVGSEALDTRSILVTQQGWLNILERSEEALGSYHQQHPLRSGMPVEELRSRLKYTPRIATRIVEKMIQGGRLTKESIAEKNSLLSLGGHEVVISPQHQVSIDAFLAAMGSNPTRPPGDLHGDPEIVNYLVEKGEIVRLTDDLLIGTSVFSTMVEKVMGRLSTEGQVTLVEVRDMLDTTRPYAFALLEHLDHSHLARRNGSTLTKI